MNSLDHIFESLETIFAIKNTYILDADPGSGMEKIRTVSGIHILDLQH